MQALRLEKRGEAMEVLAKTYRGELVDLVSWGTIVVVDSDGSIVYERGDAGESAYPRSSAKLMQAMGGFSLGSLEKFSFTPEEVATICASHSAEDFHLKAVRSILAKIGLEERYLQCGAHYPYKLDVKEKMERENEKATAIHNNCSGKHAGMLASAVLLGEDPATYLDLRSGAQQAILDVMARLCEIKKEDIKIGIDGCSAPVHSMPIRNFAYGMARMTDRKNMPSDLAPYAELILNSMHAHAKYSSGSDRLDCYLMNRANERIVAKSGANGYYLVCFPERRQALVVKCYQSEGIYRDRLVIEYLKKAGIIEKKDYAFFDECFDPKIYNHKKTVVGEIRCEL